MGSTLDFLMDHADSGSVSFHMPGHKGAAFYRMHGYGDFAHRLIDCDVTEISGADNLFHADGILKEIADKYAKIYGAKRSFLLVNGTSCGIIAGILASVPRGGKIIMARNSHKSVYNALQLGDIKPVYVYPSVMENVGISGPVAASDIADALEENPDASAVILPNPDYYGICSDLSAIAKVVHEHDKVLIVDQAHGAHLKMMESFGELPLSAETAGADIIIGSTHKTLASFTQSAVMNLCSDRVDEAVIEDKLQMIESSSPSYILMASLDVNADIIIKKGAHLFKEWAQNVDWFYSRCGGWLMERSAFLDHTKLNIDASKLGCTGDELAGSLMEREIYPELWTGNILMCMTGIGTTREHLEKLAEVLEEIAERNDSETVNEASVENALPASAENALPASAEGELWAKRRETFAAAGPEEIRSLEESTGMLCMENIVPYPPGIPIICRGEKIDSEDVSFLKTLLERGHDVLGIRDGKVRCCKPL